MSKTPIQYESEVKCLQLSWEDFPPDVLQAMIDKKEHPKIYRHGRVDQIYLDTARQEVFDRVIAALNKRNLAFGSNADQEKLGNPKSARELRIMLKPDRGVAQITIKGHPTFKGISCPQLETAPDDTHEVEEIIRSEHLIDDPKLVRGRIEKVWHDIQTDIDGKIQIVEHDILTSHDDLLVVETEVELAKEEDAVAEIERMITKKKLPPWFQKEVTSRPDLKNANIAVRGIPQDIQVLLKKIDPRQRALTRAIAKAYGR